MLGEACYTFHRKIILGGSAGDITKIGYCASGGSRLVARWRKTDDKFSHS